MLAAVSILPDDGTLDDALRHRVAAGERDAVGEVARMYYPSMRRWALLETADPQLAEEAVQNALTRMLRYARSYDPELPLEPWLRGLVRNAARDARRPWFRFDRLPWTRRRSVDEQADLSRAARRALELLQRLTPRQRELIDLCDLQGCSAVEAAERLGIQPATARVHLHEARKQLKQWMGPEVAALLKEVAP